MARKAKAKAGALGKAKAKGKAKTTSVAFSRRAGASSAVGVRDTSAVRVHDTSASSHVQFFSGTKDEIRALFIKHDTSGNNVLDLDEFTSLMKYLDSDMSETNLVLLYKSIDSNNNGTISFDEFLDYLFQDIDSQQRLGATSSKEASTAWGHELSAPSVYHLSGKLLDHMTEKNFEPKAKVYDIEERVIRGQGQDVLCPRDGQKGAAYVDSIGKDCKDIGVATHMLSYSWAYRHRVVEHRRAGKTVPFDVFEKVFHDRVSQIGNVIAMMAPWDAPVYITRVWCDFELYTAAKNGATVHIAMPPSEAASFVCALKKGDGIEDMWQVIASLDVEVAQASVIEDRLTILSMIERGLGFVKFNYIVAKQLQTWIVNTSEAYLRKELELGASKSLNELRDLTRFASNVGDLKEMLVMVESAMEDINVEESLKSIAVFRDEIQDRLDRIRSQI